MSKTLQGHRTKLTKKTEGIEVNEDRPIVSPTEGWPRTRNFQQCTDRL